MRLIGMMDSPYVRRVAVSLRTIGLAFEHEPLSVFRHFDRFAAINPVVKAPTLICDDGLTLIDSTLILAYLDRLAPPERQLTPSALGDMARAQRIIGLALTACEKTVQIVYELNLRPAEKQHEPWLERVRGQLRAAYRLLDEEVRPAAPWLFGPRPMQADITAAVAWGFTHYALPEAIGAADHPRLAALAQRAEVLDAFRESPIE